MRTAVAMVCATVILLGVLLSAVFLSVHGTDLSTLSSLGPPILSVVAGLLAYVRADRTQATIEREVVPRVNGQLTTAQATAQAALTELAVHAPGKAAEIVRTHMDGVPVKPHPDTAR